eukprot:Opistho-1_new@50262
MCLTCLNVRNCVKVEQLEDPVTPVGIILRRCAPEQIMELYGVPAFNDHNEFLVHLARKQGKLKKGGIADIATAAKSVLQDWNSGKIPFYTRPPAADHSHIVSATIVSSWGREFNIDEIAAEEREALGRLGNSGTQYMALESGGVAQADAAMLMENEGEDEDEDDDEDDGAAMEVEGDDKVVAPIASKAKGAATAPSKQKLKTAEDALNPQTNRDKKKLLKAAVGCYCGGMCVRVRYVCCVCIVRLWKCMCCLCVSCASCVHAFR